MHQSIPAMPTPPPPRQPWGICSRCQSRGWGIRNFIAARGLGISIPSVSRGDPRAFGTHFWKVIQIVEQRINSEVRGQKIFSLPRVVPCIPLLGLMPSGLFMGLSSTLIYTSELILCSTIWVPSATRRNIHMYHYFLFAAIHHLKSSPTFSVQPCSSSGRVTVDLIRRSWVRFPPRSKDLFFTSCGSLFPFTRANAQWVIHGFK